MEPPAVSQSVPPATTTPAVAERVSMRRQRFIEAGIQLFGSLGYHQTTMRLLTAEAGLTNRYFYQSFQSMEDLLVACYQHLMDDYRYQLQAILDANHEDLQAQIRAGLYCFFEAMQRPHFARITHREILGVSPRVDALYSDATASFAALLMDYLRRAGVALPPAPHAHTDLLGSALAGAVIHTGLTWSRGGYAEPIAVVVEVTAMVVLGVAGRLGGSSRSKDDSQSPVATSPM